MQSTISLKRLLFIVSIVGITLSSIAIFFLTFSLPGRSFYTKSSSFTNSQTPQNLIADHSVESIQGVVFQERASLFGSPAGRGLPIRLKIPKINIDTALEAVGLTSEGAVGVPKDPTLAAWFDLGPRPGDNGCAVITGHYGFWKNGEGSVFNDLSKLRKGDSLSVEDEKGDTAIFVVRGIRRYNPNANVSDVFDSDDGKPHLNLITCDGVWNKVSKSYSERLVVFTDKEVE